MCGRINVSDNEGVRMLLAMLGMDVWPSRDPRFNIAPTQALDVVTWQNDAPAFQTMQWGVMPSWAKPGKFSAPLINARSETVHEKPSFRKLIAEHRVLVPITGFYEWYREGKSKTPYYIQPSNTQAMFLGGIFQPVQGQSNETDDIKPQVCLITLASNDSMSKVHHRMPLILEPADALSWIKPGDKDELNKLMQPASNDALVISEIGDYVNSSRNEGPECIAPKRVNDLFD